MSIKMLIVDDEPIISKGLKLTIPWETYDIEVKGTAQNGLEALDLIKKYDIDVILCDIRMPEMDGLELSEILREEVPQVKIVIISGYADFEYAKKAINLGVKDYLLKPVNIEELITIVKRIKQEIVNSSNHIKAYNYQKIKNGMYNLLCGGTWESYECEISNYLPDLNLQLCLSEIKDYKNFLETHNYEHIKQLQNDFQKTVAKSLPEEVEHLSFFIHENLLVNCILIPNKQGVNKKVMASIKTISSEYHKFNHTLFDESFDPKLIKDKYNILKNEKKQQIFSEKNLLIVSENINNNKTTRTLPFEIEKEFISGFSENEKNDEKLNELFDYFRINKYTAEEIVLICQHIELTLKKKVSHLLLEDNFDLSLQGDIDLWAYNSYDSLKALFKMDLSNLSEILNKDEGDIKNPNSWLIKKALRYIQANYQHDLKAKDIADFINISPNYFSNLFKKTTGKSFNEYLNELRIEKAQNLLKDTSERVFEIAKYVGYKDYKYFVYNFKKRVLMTPTNYRNSLYKKEKV